MRVRSDYEGRWEDVQDDCMLCEMEKRTEWYLETRDWVVAEKLSSGPFIVYKKHTKSLTDDEWDRMEHIVGLVYDDFEIDVRMGMVPDHWHGHILPKGEHFDLTNE